ncbi:MAG: ribonuclease III [Elusimicrobiota bacterium]
MLDELQKKIKVKFKDPKFLDIAITHKSFAIENDLKEFNERMEFLGDAVLSTMAAIYFYSKYPSYDEGNLSKIKSSVVSGVALQEIAKKLELGKFIKMSISEESTGGRCKESILANTVEAIIGAIFLDSGYKITEKFVWELLDKQEIVLLDFKSELQKIIQSKHKMTPTYIVKEETGPAHNKIFKVVVSVKKKQIGAGLGKSKKEAQQSAAKDALIKLKINLETNLS